MTEPIGNLYIWTAYHVPSGELRGGQIVAPYIELAEKQLVFDDWPMGAHLISICNMLDLDDGYRLRLTRSAVESDDGA